MNSQPPPEAVDDRVTLELDDRRTTLTVVGETMAGGPGPAAFLTDWQTLAHLAPDSQVANHDVLYQVEIVPGTDIPAYLELVSAADPGLDAWDSRGSVEVVGIVKGFSLILTLMLGTVVALGASRPFKHCPNWTQCPCRPNEPSDLAEITSVGDQPATTPASAATANAPLPC